jgi:cation:H+ antiporter
MELWILLIALILILIGAEAFTNALEHLGQRLGISEGVTGSIFAAVGTALPEAMVPIVAVLASTASLETRHEVGVGAILGAPLMLSTLTLFMMGMFAAHSRGWNSFFRPEPTGLRRDLNWFLFAFILATIAVFVPVEWRVTRVTLAIGLTLSYLIYIMLTIRASRELVDQGHGTEADHPLFLTRIRLPENLVTIMLQLLLGLALIVGGAKGFVYGIEHLAAWLGISTLALSLLIIPVATELPEKVNSILWIRRGKDTLAFGNITGAMVFQGSLLPALGVMLTPWVPRPEVLLGMGLTFVATTYLLFMARNQGLKPHHVILNGLCYLVFVILVTII